MFNPATGPETTHMILAALMVTGFGVASVYAVAMLRGRRDRYHRLGLLIPLTVAAIVTPIQIVVGDWAARAVAADQPTKLAAMEGLAHTTKGAPESLSGYYSGAAARRAAHPVRPVPADPAEPARHRARASTPSRQRPALAGHRGAPVLRPMVSIGFGLLALGAWLAWTWWRRRDLPRSRLFLLAVAVSGVAAVAAMEPGWVTTEVGRQPWIVYHVLRVAKRSTPSRGIQYGDYGSSRLHRADRRDDRRAATVHEKPGRCRTPRRKATSKRTR